MGGAQSWRNSAVIRSELGWQLTGHERCLLEGALRHARVHLLDGHEFYTSMSALAEKWSCGWTVRVTSTIKSHGLLLWTDWRWLVDLPSYV